jgi:hypothetical protein
MQVEAKELEINEFQLTELEERVEMAAAMEVGKCGCAHYETICGLY